MNHRGCLKGPDAVRKTWPDITQASQFDLVTSLFYIKEKKKNPKFCLLSLNVFIDLGTHLFVRVASF